jgi:hypothetical protein
VSATMLHSFTAKVGVVFDACPSSLSLICDIGGERISNENYSSQNTIDHWRAKRILTMLTNENVSPLYSYQDEEIM